jgi:hypothetical protein
MDRRLEVRMRALEDFLKPLRGLAVLALLLATSGCAVGMALSGDPAPDLAACRIGADRTSIEDELGPPVTVDALPDGGTACVYDYTVGNEPSPGRAIAHGTMDVLTFALWEVVGTPIEAVQGQRYQMTVIYGADGEAREISTIKVGR